MQYVFPVTRSTCNRAPKTSTYRSGHISWINAGQLVVVWYDGIDLIIYWPKPDNQKLNSNFTLVTTATARPRGIDRKRSDGKDRELAHLSHTQTQSTNVLQFSRVIQVSGSSSLPFLLSLAAWMQFRRSLERSGPHWENRNPCFQTL
jgi:hypothetical protein